jgi:hypothetical protein
MASDFNRPSRLPRLSLRKKRRSILRSTFHLPSVRVVAVDVVVEAVTEVAAVVAETVAETVALVALVAVVAVAATGTRALTDASWLRSTSMTRLPSRHSHDVLKSARQPPRHSFNIAYTVISKSPMGLPTSCRLPFMCAYYCYFPLPLLPYYIPLDDNSLVWFLKCSFARLPFVLLSSSANS